MLVPIGLAIALFLADVVTVEVVVHGEAGAGVTVTAVNGEVSVRGVADEQGVVALALPADTEVVLQIDGLEAGVIRTPPPGYKARLSLEWPPAFTIRVRELLPHVGTGSSRQMEPVAGRLFRVAPLDPQSEVRDLRTDQEGSIVIDWLLPGRRFDLLHRPSGSGNIWLWYAGPFDVEANAEEEVRFTPGGRVRLDDIQFETGTHRLDPRTASESERVLAIFAAQARDYLASRPDEVLGIDGHTDDLGSRESNRELSLKRAEMVRAYLVGQGVDPQRVIATGYGEDAPVDTNDHPEGRAANRRVELHFSKKPVP